MTLGSFWDHFGIIFGRLWDHFGIIKGRRPGAAGPYPYLGGGGSGVVRGLTGFCKKYVLFSNSRGSRLSPGVAGVAEASGLASAGRATRKELFILMVQGRNK